MRTPRLTERPVDVLRRAAGSRRDVVAKLSRLAHALATYARPSVLDARLDRLASLGYVDVAPTRLQLVVGSIDMLRFWISPAAAEYYAERASTSASIRSCACSRSPRRWWIRRGSSPSATS